ncbi:uncharacterized protein B0H18DRAFT_960550 [Fomitopsis serialis]|uniref:uncharacterized protein n=1 Tax=Fomitopsis serialis TaxID=139415 RepID=UPI002007A544|nr:uncharacterized protein B0H18DRAFT_960550 [Neoantrodia serialis]KAH9913185.1 hypothetical protein B0H18DRAFT_960550 [Neoantrodia serialis]
MTRRSVYTTTTSIQEKTDPTKSVTLFHNGAGSLQRPLLCAQFPPLWKSMQERPPLKWITEGSKYSARLSDIPMTRENNVPAFYHTPCETLVWDVFKFWGPVDTIAPLLAPKLRREMSSLAILPPLQEFLTWLESNKIPFHEDDLADWTVRFKAATRKFKVALRGDEAQGEDALRQKAAIMNVWVTLGARGTPKYFTWLGSAFPSFANMVAHAVVAQDQTDNTNSSSEAHSPIVESTSLTVGGGSSTGSNQVATIPDVQAHREGRSMAHGVSGKRTASEASLTESTHATDESTPQCDNCKQWPKDEESCEIELGSSACRQIAQGKSCWNFGGQHDNDQAEDSIGNASLYDAASDELRYVKAQIVVLSHRKRSGATRKVDTNSLKTQPSVISYRSSSEILGLRRKVAPDDLALDAYLATLLQGKSQCIYVVIVTRIVPGVDVVYSLDFHRGRGLILASNVINFEGDFINFDCHGHHPFMSNDQGRDTPDSKLASFIAANPCPRDIKLLPQWIETFCDTLRLYKWRTRMVPRNEVLWTDVMQALEPVAHRVKGKLRMWAEWNFSELVDAARRHDRLCGVCDSDDSGTVEDALEMDIDEMVSRAYEAYERNDAVHGSLMCEKCDYDEQKCLWDGFSMSDRHYKGKESQSVSNCRNMFIANRHGGHIDSIAVLDNHTVRPSELGPVHDGGDSIRSAAEMELKSVRQNIQRLEEQATGIRYIVSQLGGTVDVD